MLIKLNHDVGIQVTIPGLPPSVISIEPVLLTYNAGHDKKMTYIQFPTTLAYVITDYKCQGQTFKWVIVDLKKLNRGSSLISSPDVQLSRAKTRACLSIPHPFDPAELCFDLSKHILAELK